MNIKNILATFIVSLRLFQITSVPLLNSPLTLDNWIHVNTVLVSYIFDLSVTASSLIQIYYLFF